MTRFHFSLNLCWGINELINPGIGHLRWNFKVHHSFSALTDGVTDGSAELIAQCFRAVLQRLSSQQGGLASAPCCTQLEGALSSVRKAPQHSCPKDDCLTRLGDHQVGLRSTNKYSKLKIHHNVCISFQNYVGIVITTEAGDNISAQSMLACTSNTRHHRSSKLWAFTPLNVAKVSERRSALLRSCGIARSAFDVTHIAPPRHFEAHTLCRLGNHPLSKHALHRKKAVSSWRCYLCLGFWRVNNAAFWWIHFNRQNPGLKLDSMLNMCRHVFIFFLFCSASKRTPCTIRQGLSLHWAVEQPVHPSSLVPCMACCCPGSFAGALGFSPVPAEKQVLLFTKLVCSSELGIPTNIYYAEWRKSPDLDPTDFPNPLPICKALPQHFSVGWREILWNKHVKAFSFASLPRIALCPRGTWLLEMVGVGWQLDLMISVIFLWRPKLAHSPYPTPTPPAGEVEPKSCLCPRHRAAGSQLPRCAAGASARPFASLLLSGSQHTQTKAQKPVCRCDTCEKHQNRSPCSSRPSCVDLTTQDCLLNFLDVFFTCNFHFSH